jgi:hypothetical protein
VCDQSQGKSVKHAPIATVERAGKRRAGRCRS